MGKRAWRVRRSGLAGWGVVEGLRVVNSWRRSVRMARGVGRVLGGGGGGGGGGIGCFYLSRFPRGETL